MPRNTLIQCRNGTYAAWDAQSSTILASGEPGFAIDFNILKIGDGTTQWGDLAGINDAMTTVVRNNTGSTIPKMSVVYINGAQGDTPTIQLAIANGELTSSKTYGITTGSISSGGTGRVVAEGALKNLSTSPAFDGVTPGAVLYLSPTVSGGITTTKPSAPDHLVTIGNLVRVHSQQGAINVKIQNGFELGELHNVAINGTSNGKFLQYNSGSGLWIASSSGNFSSLTINNNPIVTGTGLTNYILKWSSNSGVSNSSLYDDGSQAIRFGYNNAGYVYISDDWAGGELGLVTSDQQSIAINYPSDGSFRYGGGPVGGENIVVASGGNVGIGTDAPTEKLTVNGNSNFIGNITSSTGNFIGLSVNNYIDIISSGSTNANIIRFNDTSTPNSPSLGSVSNGTRLMLSKNDSFGHNAIGVEYGGGERNNTWFSVPSGMGFSFYNGSNSIFSLGESQLNYNGNFIVGSDGNINSAIWNATAIAVNKGGTGRTSYSNGQLLIGSGTSLVANTLTAGTGISITNGSGTITINSSLNNPVTGTGIANHIAYWNSSSGIVADSGQLVWDSTNNRLGIGTSTPSGQLHVVGTGIISSRLGIATNSPGSSLDVRGSAVFNEDGANVDFRIEGDNDTHLVFVDASADNVGIGYSTPTTKLQVNGTFSCGGGYGGEPVYGGQGLYVDPVSPLLRLNDSGPNTIADIDLNGLTLYDVASSPFFYTDRTNSRIGIGTSSPNANLAISAGGAGGTIDGAAQSQPFQINDATVSDYINLAHFNITNSGSRGSFTLSNNSSGAWENNVMQFFVHGNGYAHGYYGGNSNDAGCAMIVTQGSQINKLQIGNISSVPIEFFTGNAFRMKIDSDGDVGIGIATPLYKLDVNGTIGDSTNGYVVVQDLNISNTAAGTISIDAATNNLSIGGDGTITIASVVDQQVNINSNVDVNGDLTFNSYTEKVVSIGNSSTSKTISLASGTVQTCTLTGNCTFTMPTATAGKSFTMFLSTGSGNYTANFSGVRWADSATPTATITANKVDIFSFISDGSYWYGSFSQNYG